MITLQLKKEWYDMIYRKEKVEDYREIKPYYDKRLKSLIGQNNVLFCFQNGYHRNARAMICRCSVFIGQGRTEWGAENEIKLYYVIKINKRY